MTTHVKHYHWTGEGSGLAGVRNWGDELGPLLLKRFAGIRAESSTFAEAQLVTVGSVLQLMPKFWPGVILGSGKIRENSEWLPSRRTKILALRGPLTARGIPGSYALGDPGVLCDRLLDELPEKKYDLILVPHWSDTELAKRPEFLKYNPEIVRASDDPLEVIRKIGQARKVVTSSLHGCIVADAFGIPRRIEGMALTKLDSWDKWRDYHASICMKFEVGITSQPRYSNLEDLQHSMLDAFRALRTELPW